MYIKRFASLVLACFVSVSFYLPAALAEEIIIEEIGVVDIEAASGAAYVVGEGGLEVGTLYHIDRQYTIVSMPEELEGATYIMTLMNDDGSRGDEFLTFTLESPALVWVAYDSRGQEDKGGHPVGWLSEDETWEKHPDMIIENTDTAMGFFIPWSKEFDKGEVILGGNKDDGTVGTDAMYIVFLTGSTAAVESLGKLSTTWAELKS